MKRRETPTKRKILLLFEGSSVALSSSMIEAELLGEVDRSTVYRILMSFEKDGVIHKIADPEGKVFYALCKSCSTNEHHHNHFHFKCNKCNKIECLDQKIPEPSKKGYVFNDFFGLIDGVCPKCVGH
jgi:Fur family ferric uptake transcriptional regulator